MIELIVSIALPVLFLIGQKVFPLSSAAAKTNKPIGELRAKYQKLDFIQLGGLVLSVPILVFLYFKLFTGAYDYRLSLYNGARITVGYRQPFIIIAMFSGMITATIILTCFIKSRLKHDWDEYVAYNNLKYGMNYNRITLISMNVMAGIAIVLSVAVFDWFIIFRHEDILVNRLLGFGSHSYVYTDVSEIRDVLKVEAPNGDIINDEHYVIVFNDGEKWNSRDSGFSNVHEDSQIIKLVQSKTGKQIVKLEFDK
jgi:hypothetical protein